MSLIKRLTQFFQLSPNVKQAAKDQRAREVFLGRIAAGAGKRKRRGTMAFPPPQPTTPAAALPTPTAVHSAAEEAKAAAALAAPLWGESTLEGFGGSGGGPWSETTPSDLLKSMLPALEKLKNLVFTFKYVRINTLSVRVNLRGETGNDNVKGLELRVHTVVYHSRTSTMARFLRRLRRDVITDILSQAGRNFSNIGVLIRDMFGHKRSGSGAAGGGNADFHQGGEAPWERSTFFSPTKRLPSTKAIRTAPSPRLAVTPRAAHAMILGVAATPASPQRPRFLPDLGNKIKRALAKPIRKLLRRKDTEVLRRQREEMAAKQRLFRGEGMEED
ncbi:unnamed protein product, partial [Symbiodinium sp. KB8]